MKPLSVSFSATSSVCRESRMKRFWVSGTIGHTGYGIEIKDHILFFLIDGLKDPKCDVK